MNPNDDRLPGRTAVIDGEEWLYFSGTAYLGVVRDERFRELVKEGLDRYGAHYGGSRLADIRLDVFAEAEATLARLAGAPAALVVSSGSVAGQLALRELAGRYPAASFAPGLHPALWPEGYAPFRGSFGEWTEEVARLAEGPGPGLLALANSVDSLYARAHDFSWLERLRPRRPAALLVDDSHGFGVCSREGRGVFGQLAPPPGVETAVISSLGKAFGIPAGVIFGAEDLRRRLWVSPHFGGASPPSPAFLYAFVRGQEIYRENRRRLEENVRRFKQAIDGTGAFQSFGDYPVFYTSLTGLAGYLRRRQILVSSFAYPTPADPVVTRVVINALHTEEDIGRLSGLCLDFLKDSA